MAVSACPRAAAALAAVFKRGHGVFPIGVARVAKAAVVAVSVVSRLHFQSVLQQ
jgi:hypothetical protein